MKAYKTWAKGKVKRALQLSIIAHNYTKRAKEEISSVINKERELYHAREVAERRAKNAE